ncbi:hypothetical protein N9Z02_02945, partial [Akkermansiaceae bacterium]|nr:hypothetical protein [Akkermansiaceae bacterium]
YVGGAFTSVNGIAQRGLAILHQGGTSFDIRLSPGFDGEVHAICDDQSGGPYKVVGGAFTTFNGRPAGNLVSVGFSNFPESPETWMHDHQVNGPVYALENRDVSGPPRIETWVGGDFSQIGDLETSNLAQIWGSGLNLGQFNGPVREIVLFDTPQFSVVARGDFTTYADEPVPGVVFLSYDLSPILNNELPEDLPISQVTSLSRAAGGHLRLGHADGSVSHYCHLIGAGHRSLWERTLPFAESGPAMTSEVTASQSDEFTEVRMGYNSYHGSASGELVKLRGLHGSTPPPAPDPSFVVRNDRLLPLLPSGLSHVEQQCEISSDEGETWHSLDSSEAFFYRGLYPEHSYLLRARYRNSNGFGPYSEILPFVTSKFTRHPGAPIPMSFDRGIFTTYIEKIYQGENGSVIALGDFSETRDWRTGRTYSGLGLFDANFNFVSIKETSQEMNESLTLMPDGSILFIERDLFFEEGYVFRIFRMILSFQELRCQETRGQETRV